MSDARFWGFYSICGMLMRIRQLYMHEHALMPWDTVSNELILPWISEQEAKWDRMEDEQFGNIQIDGVQFTPFDVEGVNARLNPHGILYGAGLGLHHKPTFFLGRLLNISTINNCTVYITGEEFVRDLFASPAMLQGSSIYVRLRPLYSILYEKFAELQGRKPNPILADAFRGLGLDPKAPVTDDFPARFTALAADVSKILIAHEAAEYVEDAAANTWIEILDGSKSRFVEIYIRAMKDLLADTSQAGPLRHIIDTQDKAMLAFYVALLDNARIELFPEITPAYEEFSATGNWQSIEYARGTAYARAKKFRQDTLSLWKTDPDTDIIETHIKSFLKNIKDAL
ncbi:MAG: hypothetical protein HQL01_12420 [Nitrospirae bacterium]|nr:hypothetical protein [Nitrospirota bacterium]